MSAKPFIAKGGIYIFLYILVSASANVFVNHSTRSIPPIVTLFYTSIFTIVFFSLLNFGELAKNIVLIKQNKKPILWLNLLNAAIWFVIVFCLKFLSPAVFSCLLVGAIPINLFLLGLRKSKASKRHNITIGLLLLLTLVLMLSLVAQEITATNASKLLTYGAIVTIIGGMTAAFIMKISKLLATKNLSASLVVSLRFYGLLVISFIVIISTKAQLFVAPIVLTELFALALISMALPLFLLQKAFDTLSPLFASIVITVIPVLTYFLQLLTGHYSFSTEKLGITVLFSISLTILTYLKSKEKIA